MGCIMYKNSTHALIAGLENILNNGRKITVRGNEVKEILSQLIRIENPAERVIITPFRKNNIFSTIAETIWVIGGRNDLDYLSHYLHRAIEFSDDGKTWRGGYGPRLRNWYGYDQFKLVVDLLLDDRNSRRAVMIIFDPAKDYVKSKDIPCNNWLHFIIRENKLHLNVSIRSNDVIWGFSGINTFEWSVLHEMMAFWTNTQVGEFSYFISSFHLYKRHYKRAQNIIENKRFKTLYDYGFVGSRFTTHLSDFDNVLSNWFEIEKKIRLHEKSVIIEFANIKDEFLRNCLEMLYLYNRYLNNCQKEEIANLIKDLSANDFKIAAIDFFTRCFKDKNCVELDEREKYFFKYYWQEEKSDIISFESIFEILKLLHYKKTLVYKDSWKKHGEVIGIFANISRKYDRINAIIGGIRATSDETLFDTLADLAVYSTKYLTYLAEHYQSIFYDFIKKYPPIEKIDKYQYNEGFDWIADILVRRFNKLRQIKEENKLNKCYEIMKQKYMALEDILIKSDWSSPNPEKCTLIADLAISSIKCLVLLSREDFASFQKFQDFVNNL